MAQSYMLNINNSIYVTFQKIKVLTINSQKYQNNSQSIAQPHSFLD